MAKPPAPGIDTRHHYTDSDNKGEWQVKPSQHCPPHSSNSYNACYKILIVVKFS